MQDEVNNLKTYAKQHEMVINDDKTKVILFNNKKSLDFQPHIILESEECLEVVVTLLRLQFFGRTAGMPESILAKAIS